MHASIRSIIDERAETCPDTTFIVDAINEVEISFAQLRTAVQSVARLVHSNGVAPGDSVAFAMNNSCSCALVVLGIMYGGYRATAINLVSGPATIAYVLEHSEAKLIVTEAKQQALLENALSINQCVLPSIVIDTSNVKEFLNERSEPFELSEPDYQSDGLLMYTSGTTGQPKGVLLSHANLLAGGENTRLAHDLKPEDRALCVLPLYHINGLTVTIMGPLVSGGSVVLPTRFSVSRFWPLINQYGCTWFSVVPTQISYLLHAPVDESDPTPGQTSLRFGRSASAPLSPEVQQNFEARFGVPIIETMGLTETTAPILSNPLPPGVRKIGSPGIAFGDEVLITDKDLNEVARNVEGEIMVRGTNVMKAYFKNPTATKDALTASGWLRTGDLGKQDDDGYIFVTGRLKELIIKGGENIAPREIDEALYKHPAVIEAAAFACPCTDFGQRVEAAVSIGPDTDLSESKLLEFCRPHLGDFKMPDKIHFLEELPKGPSGKIQRRRLVELFAQS